MAKSEGYVNPQSLIAALAGTSRAEARKIDRLGKSLMQAAETSVDSANDHAARGTAEAADGCSVERPWFTTVTESMVAGEITPDRCDAIRAGLGEASDTVTNEVLAEAAARLLDLLHADDSPETVFRDARQARALLDRDSVAANENALQSQQEAKVWMSRDGMVHLRADFAPEDGAWVKNTLDLILGPRIGGPRFAAGPEGARSIIDDPRSTEQIRASALISLLKAGAEVDDNAILARKRPSVQVIITASELGRPDDNGVAFIEGSRYPVTKRTVDRLICDTGYAPVVTNSNGSPLDLGRDVRLFTPAQRVVLATLQGGCVWNGCDKPPSMCEAHHIDHWAQHGKTNIRDGVLLCRYHHQQLHNHGWSIGRTTPPSSTGQHVEQRYEHDYWLTPPPDQDPEQKPIRLRFRATAHPIDHGEPGPVRGPASSPSRVA